MYDLIINGGTCFDGLGSEGVVADVGVSGDKVVAVGRLDEGGRRTIDATGRFVAPGFIDGHTHLDAQIFWDPCAGSLLAHGVTSAVMGNCGFTLAPGSESQSDLVIRSIERAEDMSRDAITRGVQWQWTSFPEFLSAVDQLPKAINVTAQIGHSALRASVMGERAFGEAATEDDLREMERAVKEAVSAGSWGFSTSRSNAHLTKSGVPVASRSATWDEVARLVMAMARSGGGMFQLAPERSLEPDHLADFQSRFEALAVASQCPVTFMVGGQEEQLGTIERIVRAGARATGQVHVRGFENIFGFRTGLPFDRLPLWSTLRSEPLDLQRARLLDREFRARLVDVAEHGTYGEAVGAEVRPPKFDELTVIGDPDQPEESVTRLAQESGRSPVEVMIDLSLATNFDQLFRQPISDISEELIVRGLKHPRSVIAASDSGAHISQILDSNIPTWFLAHWVRAREEFSWAEAIKMLTSVPAGVWAMEGRGTLQAGSYADLVVFDPSTIGSEKPTVLYDLPDGGPRLAQGATGIDAVIVNGEEVMAGGEPTGTTSGVLITRGCDFK